MRTSRLSDDFRGRGAGAARAGAGSGAACRDATPSLDSRRPASTSPVSGHRPLGKPPAGFGESETGITAISAEELPPPTPPVELPEHARRDPWVVGRLDPVKLGLGVNPWGTASGAFLSSLMRRTDTPIASRWAHIALRNALLAKVRAPRNVNPVDWVAERAWLLLRMGEADAARMLVSGVDVDKFTPKMFQVAVQSALANADPAGLCPLLDGVRKVEPRVLSAGRRDVRILVRRAGKRRGPDRCRAPPRADRGHRPGAGAEGRRRGRRHRPGGDGRVGTGRSADQLAFRPGHRHRHDRCPIACSSRRRRRSGRGRRGRPCCPRSSGSIRRASRPALACFHRSR